MTLAAADEPLTVDELTTRVAATDLSDPSLASDSSADRARELAHIHLPKLADYNIIEYDRSTKTITPTIPAQVETMVQEMIDLADDF
ncbi:hypothetical protein DMJ13_26150 [halophilic archaeon]|nr:hypothetical protein DMJ13_26150 [halophilic archaeon]